MLKSRQLFWVVRWWAHLEIVTAIASCCALVKWGQRTSGMSRRVLVSPPNSQVNW